MRLPTMRGTIDRRILVNYRVDPEVLARLLPAPFRPLQVGGFGIAGICLIRLRAVRPRYWPSFAGVASENAAHRIAVEWHVEGERQTGVYIPRRDTSSLLNCIAGGRLFPGQHHRAHFEAQEQGQHYRLRMESLDGDVHVRVAGSITDQLPRTSLFETLPDAAAFFQLGSLGYSPAATVGQFEGLEFCTPNWQLEPLAIDSVESSYFDDRSLFPPGSACFDSALLMRGIPHEWHARETLCCGSRN